MSLRTFIKHLVCKNSLPLKTLTRTISFSQPSPTNSSDQFQQDPHSLLKEDPVQICLSMWVKSFSSPPTTSFPNLTGFLSKFDLWVLAYQRSCAHVTGTFPPRNAIHSQVLHDLLSLRNAVVHGRFSWNEKTRQIVRSPNDKPVTKILSRRKLEALLDSDEPCFQDRVVQEVLLMILEPVFEARFSRRSHAFRPNRNAHTVIRTIRSNFAGYLWFLRGDLSEIFDNVEISVVMGCLEKAVKDKKILGLVKSALKAPVRSRPRRDSGAELEKKKKKRGATKKRILNENEPKPDPYWLRTFFDFAPEEAAKA